MDIPGPEGTLEADYQPATRPGGAQAVLCHPHPQYGGSLHDGVLDVLARVLLDAGVGVLRFNFRGVGASSGRYGGGDGEADDLLAAAAWLQETQRPSALWLGGYSFGAYVTWQALDRGLEPGRVMLVAPPVGAMQFPSRDPRCPVDVFAGDADEFIEARALAAWTGITTHVIEGANHFFLGRTDALAESIRQAIGDRP